MEDDRGLTAIDCSSCRGNTWNFYIRHEKDKTFLVMSCADKKCHEEKREELGGEENQLIIWAQFDVTGQGWDKPENKQVN